MATIDETIKGTGDFKLKLEDPASISLIVMESEKSYRCQGGKRPCGNFIPNPVEKLSMGIMQTLEINQMGI